VRFTIDTATTTEEKTSQKRRKDSSTNFVGGISQEDFDGIKGRVLAVSGGRNFFDRRLSFQILDETHRSRPIACIVSGGAEGADSLAEAWADANRVPLRIFYPNWHNGGKFSRWGGFERNKLIVENSSDCLIFWDSKSKGTKNIIENCRKIGKQLKIILFAK